MAAYGGQLPRWIMFDLDGTLVDSVPDLAAAIDAMLLEHGALAAGPDRVRLWVGNGASVLVRRALAHAHGIDEHQLDSALHEAYLGRFLEHYHDVSGQRSALYSGVSEALELLAKAQVPMAVVTNKPARFVPHLLAELGIAGYFGHWLGGDSLALRKPDPAPLNHLLKTAGVRPSQALMVGDSRSDVLAGKAAGVKTLGVSYGYNHGNPIEAEGPDWVASHLGDFFRQSLGVAV